ncbi:MAG TPA: hypothetical protein VFO60_04680 [Candidatus Dormibacteraeota bacterium]|nr:hypothetical protein [Candidatus Dormibacteraeota bacterium]
MALLATFGPLSHNGQPRTLYVFDDGLVIVALSPETGGGLFGLGSRLGRSKRSRQVEAAAGSLGAGSTAAGFAARVGKAVHVPLDRVGRVQSAARGEMAKLAVYASAGGPDEWTLYLYDCDAGVAGPDRVRPALEPLLGDRFRVDV